MAPTIRPPPRLLNLFTMLPLKQLCTPLSATDTNKNSSKISNKSHTGTMNIDAIIDSQMQSYLSLLRLRRTHWRCWTTAWFRCHHLLRESPAKTTMAGKLQKWHMFHPRIPSVLSVPDLFNTCTEGIKDWCNRQCTELARFCSSTFYVKSHWLMRLFQDRTTELAGSCTKLSLDTWIALETACGHLHHKGRWIMMQQNSKLLIWLTIPLAKPCNEGVGTISLWLFQHLVLKLHYTVWPMV